MFKAFVAQYLMYIILGAIALTGVTAGITGWKVRDWQCKAHEVSILQRAATEKARMQGVIDGQAAAYEKERERADAVAYTRTNTIREIFRTSPAPAADCAAPAAVGSVLLDAVQDANRSVSGTTREPSSAVPPATPTTDTSDRP
jgi:hypothetical protein